VGYFIFDLRFLIFDLKPVREWLKERLAMTQKPVNLRA